MERKASRTGCVIWFNITRCCVADFSAAHYLSARSQGASFVLARKAGTLATAHHRAEGEMTARSQGASFVLARKAGTLATAHHRAEGEMTAVMPDWAGDLSPGRIVSIC